MGVLSVALDESFDVSFFWDFKDIDVCQIRKLDLLWGSFGSLRKLVPNGFDALLLLEFCVMGRKVIPLHEETAYSLDAGLLVEDIE